MIIKAAKQAQKAVDHMLGKQEEPAKFDEEGNPVEPVGEGVGSEGKTGDQIAEDAGLKPETAPEPNVGEQGRTGEEISGEEDLNPKPNSRGLIRSEIDPADLKVGDRLDISGKTRVAAIKIEEDKVLVSTKTIGSRGGGFESFNKDKKIFVWRKEDSVGSEGKTGDEIAEDAGLKPESTPEPNIGKQGKTGEEIAQEDDIKPAGVRGGHDLSPREAFTKAVNRSDRDVKKVYGAEEIYQPQLQRDMERPAAPKREDFPDRESYIAAHKKYSKDFDNYYLERSRNIQSSIGEKHLNGSPKGVQNYVKDIITADWFVEAFGDGGQLGRPPVSLFTGKSYGGKYTYGFKNGAFISSLKINRLLSKSEPNILHEIAHFATAISVAEGHDAHGVEYRMNYIYITDKVLGREAAESLRESYRKENLNVG
jgi:hypothetical protein